MRTTTLLAAAVAVALAACGAGVGERDEAGDAIAATELAARLEASDRPLVLDVRSEREHANGRIPGAVLIPHDQLESRLAELPSDRSTEIVVHCQSGRRAAVAAAILATAGYTRVRDLEGHWQEWREAGLPTE